jgi:glycosyltransferase involved in cell wall biosynthesis
MGNKMSAPQVVSVVVPTYNRKESLRKCLDSIFMQSYTRDIEVLVVDDGSTDGTRELLEQYAMSNPRLRFFRQDNRGPSASRNKGIENARGDILCFTDDDCRVSEDWISKLVVGFKDEKIGGVGGKIQTHKPTTLIQRYVEDSRLLNQEKFKSTNFLITGNVAYKRNVLLEAGGFDVLLNACEDLDLSIRVQFLGYHLGYVDDAVVYHMFDPTLSMLFWQQYRNALGLARLHKKYTKDMFPSFNLLLYTYRLARGVISYPLVFSSVVFKKSDDSRYHLLKPLIDILILIAFSTGMIIESLFRGEYKGAKILEKVPFLEEQSINALIRKIRSKIV